MQQGFINLVPAMPATTDTDGFSGADMLVAACLAAAAQGDVSAYFDLGVAYSTGSHGIACDLIEAHKWFNLAAVDGHEEAALCRSFGRPYLKAVSVETAARDAR